MSTAHSLGSPCAAAGALRKSAPIFGDVQESNADQSECILWTFAQPFFLTKGLESSTFTPSKVLYTRLCAFKRSAT